MITKNTDSLSLLPVHLSVYTLSHNFLCFVSPTSVPSVSLYSICIHADCFAITTLHHDCAFDVLYPCPLDHSARSHTHEESARDKFNRLTLVDAFISKVFSAKVILLFTDRSRYISNQNVEKCYKIISLCIQFQ